MNTKDHDTVFEAANAKDDVLDTEAARRRMLVRLGVYGAATAPVLLGVLKADRAAAQSIGTAIPGEGTTGGGGGTVIP